MKSTVKQSAGFLTTVCVVAGLAIWLWFQVSGNNQQRCSKEPFENISLIKLI